MLASYGTGFVPHHLAMLATFGGGVIGVLLFVLVLVIVVALILRVLGR